jgi:excisionase family DNA binding protein
MNRRIYTTFEVSRFCSVDISTVMGWVDDGKLNAYRTPGGHRRIAHADLLAFLEKYQMPIHPALKKTNPRVLIVDDDQTTVRLLKRLIEKVDPLAEISAAYDGFEAGRQLELFFPDVILLDLMLPGVNGFQVCKNIRADDRKKDVRILAISGLKEPDIEKRILAQGADRFIGKPWNVDELRIAIADIMGVSEQQRATQKIERRAQSV